MMVVKTSTAKKESSRRRRSRTRRNVQARGPCSARGTTILSTKREARCEVRGNAAPGLVSTAEGAGGTARAKEALLRALLGTDRGMSASPSEVERVEDCAAELRRAMGSTVNIAAPVSAHSGKWKLVFTSAFATGGLGGSRPGPAIPTLGGALRLGQIYQEVDDAANRLDNVVSFALGNLAALTLRLSHRSMIVPPAGVEIEYIGVAVRAEGLGALSPEVDIPDVLKLLPPALQPPPSLRSSTFNTVFLDDTLRVTRGDQRELRVYIRDDVVDDDDNIAT